MKKIKEIEKKYKVKFDEYQKDYECIIIDIFENDNLNYDLTDDNILNILGLYYQFKIKNYEKMKEYYLMAIKLKNSNAMFYLGNYYKNKYNYEKMKEYYLMAIELNNNHAMFCFGNYYDDIEHNYEEMKKYYLMAIELKNSGAMNNLGYYYHIKKNYDEMKKYYLMAIELNDTIAMGNLASHYAYVEKDYNEMKKYYLMAISLNDALAMKKLCCFYEQYMQHYLLRQINSTIAMEKVEELEKNNFLGVKIFRELTEYCFNPQRLLKLCNIYDIELNDYMDII